MIDSGALLAKGKKTNKKLCQTGEFKKKKISQNQPTKNPPNKQKQVNKTNKPKTQTTSFLLAS